MKDFITTRRTAIEYISTSRAFINYDESKGLLIKAKNKQLNLDVGV